METWHKRLMQTRKAARLKAVEVARRVGVSQPTYSEWESGKIKTLSADNLLKVCRALDVTEQYLMQGRGPARPSRPGEGDSGPRETGTATDVLIQREVPLISLEQAGRWGDDSYKAHRAESGRRVKTTAAVGRRAYALRIQGDSMEPWIPHGGTVIVDPDRTPENGQVVVVRQNPGEDATVKRLVVDGSVRYLKPDNSRYPILTMPEGAEICGVCVQVLIDLI